MAEIDHNLSSFEETFKELRDTVKRARYVDTDTITVLVKAEINLFLAVKSKIYNTFSLD